MKPIIEVRDLSVAIHKNHILRHVTFPVHRNMITAVIGQSGCGKTTLLKTLNRSVEAEGAVIEGDITLDGDSIFRVSAQNIRRKIGLICQNPAPFPFSIYKNMSYALTYYTGKRAEAFRDIIIDNLKKAGLYEEVADHLDMDARNLSGGQQQRLCIARSLAVNPQVLLLDEPCSSLDIKNMMKIEETLQEIKKTYTIIIVTHNLSQARRIADYTLFMENGEAPEFGKTESIFEHASDSRTKKYMSYLL